MLYQVTIKEKDIYSENRAEAASAPIVRLFYRMKAPAAEVVSIEAPNTSPKPGQPYYNIELPEIVNIYRLNNGRILVIFADGSKCHLYASERAENIELLKAVEAGDTAATEEAKKEAKENRIDLEREEEKAKTDDENFEHCKRIARELDEIAAGDVYKCPHCGELHSMKDFEDSEHENEDGITCYTCPECGEEIEESDLEAVTMYDYLDDCLDIDYTINSRKEFQSVRVCVAWGGPSIYIDTDKKAVCLYWWSDRAQYYMSDEAVAAVDEWAEELYNC